jgi:hypothetical protein
MASLSVFDSVLLYSFIRRLVTPFKKWNAYKTGVIDADGNIIVDKKKRTEVQNRSFKMYDLLLLNLKKLLGKVPGGKSRIASYAAAIMLLREGEELDPSDDDVLWEKMQAYFEEAQAMLTEDAPMAPTNSVGDASQMAGLDDNPPANPKKVKKNMLRRRMSMNAMTQRII